MLGPTCTGWLQARLLAAWQKRGGLACLLWPLSGVTWALVTLNRYLYRAGWKASSGVPPPIIVVGNVVMGGVGKTPVVIALVEHLTAQGLRVGVISRGYGRRPGTGCVEVQAKGTAAEFGDESLLIHRRTGVPVFVARQRVHAARALLARYPDTKIIIADDGLQHHALHRELEICVFDDRGLGNGWLLPAGLLREPWPSTPLQAQGSPQPTRWLLHTGDAPKLPGYRCTRRLADCAVHANGTHIALSDFVQQAQNDATLRWIALAGIAQPEVFFAQLRERGLPLTGTESFPDHYNFDSYKREHNCRDVVFCTEKDAVKLWAIGVDCWAVPMQASLDSELLAALDSYLDPRLSGSMPFRVELDSPRTNQ